MRLALLFLVLCALAGPVSAQSLDCTATRYQQPTFATLNVTRDVVYGQNTTMGGMQQTLRMDVYEPQGDALAQRPLIVFAHGGAFVSGDRFDMSWFAYRFAQLGYVTATIDYRLIDIAITDSTQLFEGALRASHDMRAAVRYFREDAATDDRFGIHPDYIYAGGVSAGGVMSLHLAHFDAGDAVPEHIQAILDDLGGFEGDTSDNTQYASSVRGAMNYAGSLIRADWVDANSAPFYSAHDDRDPIVPYGYGTTDAFSFPAFSYGSAAVKQAADAVGVPNQLFTVRNSRSHLSFLFSRDSTAVFSGTIDFMRNLTCPTSTSVEADAPDARPGLSMYPNPAAHVVTVRNASTAPYDVTAYNALGQQVYHATQQRGEVSIPVSDWPAGTYFIAWRSSTPATHHGHERRVAPLVIAR
ncbi:MAG: T9SS type A sorting domain-containing protein [Bacteroidota bacterium]